MTQRSEARHLNSDHPLDELGHLCLADPLNSQLWDELEERADIERQHAAAAEHYRNALAQTPVTADYAGLAQRALRFHEEWLGEDRDAVTQAFAIVLRNDPAADWAFERLTLVLGNLQAWDDLLRAYDQRLAQVSAHDKRQVLLEEAAQVARDFAQAPARACTYLLELLRLSPHDNALLATLERLIERHGTPANFQELWRVRIDASDPAAALPFRLKLAHDLATRVGDFASAIDELGTLLRFVPGHSSGCDLVLTLLRHAGLSKACRDDALALAREHLPRAGRDDDLLTLLRDQLIHLDPSDRAARAAAQRELAERYDARGQRDTALEHLLQAMNDAPDDRSVRHRAQQLAESLEQVPRYYQALRSAAEQAEAPSLRLALRRELIDHLLERAQAPREASEVMREIGNDTHIDIAARVVTLQQLDPLLDQLGDHHGRLSVLTTLAQLDPSPLTRRQTWAKQAELSLALGEVDRALAAWSQILLHDPSDAQAHEARVAILEAHQRWDELARALDIRAKSQPLPDLARADLLRAGAIRERQLNDLEHALKTYLSIDHAAINDEVTAAVDRVCAALGRWDTLVHWLEPLALRHDPAAARLVGRLAYVLAHHLDRADDAAAHYVHSLSLDPSQLSVISNATRLVIESRCEHKSRVAEAVVSAWAALGDHAGELAAWQAFRPILNDRAWQRRSALRSAELARLQDRSASEILDSWIAAFALDPHDVRAEQEILAIVHQSGRTHDVAALFGQTADELPLANPRRAHLLATRAQLLQAAGDSLEAAAKAWLAAATHAPDRSDWLVQALRNALSGHHWQLSAQIMLSLEERGLPVERVLDNLESQIAASGDWPGFLQGLAQALDDHATAIPTQARGHWHLKVAIWSRREHVEHALVLKHARLAAAACDPAQRREALELIEDSLILSGGYSPELLQISSELAASSPPSRGRAVVLAKAALASDDAERTIVALGNAIDLELARASHDDASTRNEEIAWTINELVALYRRLGQPGPAYEALIRIAQRDLHPLDRAHWLALAADFALQRNDLQGATWALTQARHAAPTQKEVGDRLAELFTRQSLWVELGMLRQSELLHAQALGLSLSTQMAHRLEIAACFGRLGEVQTRLDLLATNLVVEPGHVPTLRAMTDLLRQHGRGGEVVGLLETQAQALQERDRNESSSAQADLWALAGEGAQRDLHDPERAIANYTRAAKIREDGPTIDALAQLCVARNQHAQAAHWLERQLARIPARERLSALYRAARAHAASGNWARTAALLAEAWPLRNGGQELGRLYAEALERQGSWAQLLALMLDQAHDLKDPAALAQLARRAFALANDRLNAPRLALDLLERASAGLDDNDLMLPLARALSDAQRHDEAQAVLRRLIDGFGRKRSAERAHLHVELAAVLRAQNEPTQALDELETAVAMDATRAAVLVQIAEIAGPLGHFARAEKALRSLLWLVKKQEGDSAANAPKAAWIQFRLAQLAQAQGNESQAATLWESCLESAGRHDDQAQSLQNVLREQGERARLLEVIRVRLNGSQANAKKATLWAELAELLANDNESRTEALAAALSALHLDPALPSYHELALQLALTSDDRARYRDTLVDLARRSDNFDTNALAQIHLHLAEIHALECNEGATTINSVWQALEQAELAGLPAGEVARTGARLATLVGDAVRQSGFIDRLHELGLASNETRFDSICALASVHLARPHASAEALAALEAAAQEYPNWPRLLQLLKTAHPEHLQVSGILEFWEHAARENEDEQALLNALSAQSRQPYCPEEKIREAAELAHRLGHVETAHQLFELALERATDSHSDAYLWARFGLYDLALVAGDCESAATHLQAASSSADFQAVIERALGFVEFTAKLGREALATAVFERLFAVDPYAPAVWDVLARAYISQGDATKLEALMDRCINGIEHVDDRNRLRRGLIELIRDDRTREAQVQSLLRDVLLEDPNDVYARETLLDLCERSGDVEELERLLEESMSLARENNDRVTLIRDTLRLATHVRTTGDEARSRDLVEQAYALDPQNLDVRLAMLAALPSADVITDRPEPAILQQRAELLRSLIEDGPAAHVSTWALQASALAQELDQRDLATQVLDRALERLPSDKSLLRALGELCTTSAQVVHYIERLTRQAQTLQDPLQRAEVHAHASQLARDPCGDYAQAATLIQAALVDAPHTISYWHTLIENLAQAQNFAGALAACEQALTALRDDLTPAGEAEFYAAAAEIAQVDDNLALAVQHLEAAFVRDPIYLDRLRERLGECLANARQSQDLDTERSALLRLVELAAPHRESMLTELTSYLERSVDEHQVAALTLQLASAHEQRAIMHLAARTLLTHEEQESALHATEVYVESCEALGSLDEAQRAIDWQLERWPGEPRLRALHRRMVGARGDHLGLAQLLLSDAQASADVTQRVALLRQAAEYFAQGGAGDLAFATLLRAHEEVPTDVTAAVALVDAYIDSERYDEAEAIADRCLGAFEGVKVKPNELSPMQHRKAWLRQAHEDPAGLLHWLNEAYNTDKLNFDAALALAEAAQTQADWETASRVLRNLSTLDEDQCPISRVELFARQARLWQAAGDLRKASFWAHKAKHHAPNDPVALALLQELAAASKAQGTAG